MHFTSPARTQQGFTLMELLLVVAALGLLSTVAVVAVPNLRDRARTSACDADRDVVQTALSAHEALHAGGATESELVDEGLLADASSLHDIVESDGGSQVVGVGQCAGQSGEELDMWVGLVGGTSFAFGDDGIEVTGSGERQALALGDPFSSGTIEVDDALSTTGNGWGVVFHAADNGRGQIQGFVFQMDTGYSGGRFVLRQRDGGETGPLAVTSPPSGFDWRAAHDLRLEVTPNSLRAVVDGEEVMAVDDLAAAAATVGSRYTPRRDGSVGLRLWSSSDLSIGAVRVVPT